MGCRGLCQACWKDPMIRPLYKPHHEYKDDMEMTEAELDALIAEQRKNLPKWWWKEHEKAAIHVDC